MSRISKRKIIDNTDNTSSNIICKNSKAYKIGIYARLSSKQNAKKIESIDTQIEIIKKYIDNINALGEENMIIYDIYADVGKTGTNFSRPEFIRMMGDIRLGKVNCVIVKDLSRFARDYLEAGNYIEKIFPFLGVRFIAITDNFDTTKSKGNDSKNMTMNIKNLVNDMYAKEFSKKAKIHLQQRREEGSYVGGPTPYGYTFEWEGKIRKLKVDKNTAPVIKIIYNLFTYEKKYKTVVDILNKKRINPPSVYKSSGEVYCQDNMEYKGWDKGSVRRILESSTYIGTLAQGKSSINSRDEANRVRYNKEKWTIIENAHEAIVSKEQFNEAQKIIQNIGTKYINREKSRNLIPMDKNTYEFTNGIKEVK